MNLNIDKLEKDVDPQLFIIVLKYIAKGQFNLEILEKLEKESKTFIQSTKNDIDKIDNFYSGLQIGIYNHIRRIESNKRTKCQHIIIEKYSINKLTEEMEDFRNARLDIIIEEENNLKIIQNIKTIFLEAYPEALSSPRSTPKEIDILSKQSGKNNYSSNLSTGNFLMKSPKRNPKTKQNINYC